MTPKRYCVYWARMQSRAESEAFDQANLDPATGSEISKIRPVVVVSDDMMNKNLNTVVVCPLTTSLHPKWRSRIQISLKAKQSEIAIDQIRTISIRRLGDQLGKLSPAEALKVRILITEMYGET